MAVARDRDLQTTPLRSALELRDRLTAETGCYYGVTELSLRDADPFKFERFFARVHSLVLAARDVAKSVAASPGSREMGEILFSLLTPEGDAVACSMGLHGHIAAFPTAVRYMVQNGYEINPGIRDGDVFVTNDAVTAGAPHPPDFYNYVPIGYDGEIVGWAVGLNHIAETGAVIAGGWPNFAVDTFMDGLVFPPMKVGENLKTYAWYDALWRRRTRMGRLNILDDRMRLAGTGLISQGVKAIVAEFGLDYYRHAIREIVEEARRKTLDNIRVLLTPGRYRGTAFRTILQKGMQRIFPQADRDYLTQVFMEASLEPQGRLVLDTEGTSRWGHFPFNGWPAGAKCALFMGLSQTLAHNTKVNSALDQAITAKFARGSLLNPDNDFASFGNIWFHSGVANYLCYNALFMSHFAKGYLEEVFVAGQSWEGFGGSGVLKDGTPYGFTNFEWTGGMARGATPFCDGSPMMWSPQMATTNCGHAEDFEYLMPALFYLGRGLVPNYFGHGKYRGGPGQSSVFVVMEPGQSLLMSHGGGGLSGTAALALGMAGGYPPPAAFSVVIHGTDIRERLARGEDYPRNAVECVEAARSGKIRAAEVDVWKFDKGQVSMQDGDIWANGSGSSGGWGDPLERDLANVQADLNYGWVTPDVAETVYGAVATQGSDGAWKVDVTASQERRRALLAQRRKRAVPARQWWAEERKRVMARDLIPQVLTMYREAGSFAKFDQMVREFWQLDGDFRF